MSADVIRVLPDSVANQIAAGEVIQQPASVIKELVENSVDAGADSIQIILKDAGRTLIQVVDNGKGMSDTDAALSFERHATSKISNAADLFALHTMGFRGEALASIAAIAQIDMRTMQRDASIGTRIIIEGSRVVSQTPEATVPGTNLMVKNLFYNVPARRKFLKKDSVELNNILREFEKLALVNTGVDFTVIHNDVTLQQLRKGNLKRRITELFGKQLDRQLIEIATDTSIVRLSGFIGLPENVRKRNPLQYFFVNGRNMRHPYFRKAVLSCYEGLIPADAQPNFFINFEVDPSTIDVNIHPTKQEIKFEDEQAIWQIIVAAIRESLGRFNAVPGIDFDTADTPDIPAFAPNATGDHSVDLDTDYNPFRDNAAGGSAGTGGYRGSALNSMIGDWDKLYENFSRDTSAATVPDDTEVIGSSLNTAGTPARLELDYDAGESSLLLFKNRYLMSPSAEGLMIVDRYRAGVRVLYDRYMADISDRKFTSQRVLFPEVMQLSPSESATLTTIVDKVAALGFEVTFLGDNSWSITAVPSQLGNVSAVETLSSMIATVSDTGSELSDAIFSRLALAMARATSTRAGAEMNPTEAEHLLSELLKSDSPKLTPDGRQIIVTVTDSRLAELLGN